MNYLRQKLKDAKGQIAVLLAMSFGLMILLVAMVINIGFLVTAKINLQNSVDLAAYSGAAQQARYLTELGKWNYEMRRNYKAMVYDYLITYMSELGTNVEDPANSGQYKNYLKFYMNNSKADGTPEVPMNPVVCASLQRGQGTPPTSPRRAVICQKMAVHTFQGAINASTASAATLLLSKLAICLIDRNSPACASITLAYNQAMNQVGVVNNTANADSDVFENYRDGSLSNYNVRLIAWMLHDYRQLQTRIRGVHYGDISIGKVDPSYTSGTGRWDLAKIDATTVIYKNSPMSIAAKVINGFTKADASAPALKPAAANLLEADLLKNPVNDAALRAFKNNLMDLIYDEAKLYHLTPSNFKVAKLGPFDNDMGGGCQGKCPEFEGPYLKLNRHDVDFYGSYAKINFSSGATVGLPGPNAIPLPIGNFPVGVAKDNRILTYYTVVGTAKVSKIPFNVFFGSNQGSSDKVLLVAVAAAKPFGSRIGPFIDDNCQDLYSGANKAACEANGLDPLYPFLTSGGVAHPPPNFSIWDKLDNQDDARQLGVKLAVSTQDYQPSTQSFFGNSSATKEFGNIFAISNERTGRNRHYRFQINSSDDKYKRDDGFNVTSPAPNVLKTSTEFFDHDNTAIHPQGNRNSIWAWDNQVQYAKPTYSAPNNLRNNYEGYLLETQQNPTSNFLQLYKFNDVQDREADGTLGISGKYSIYVFKYPKPKGANGWDIQDMTTRGFGSQMEEAFANAMSVSRFELKRYIIPFRNPETSGINIPSDVMDYLNKGNTTAAIYDGTTSREIQPGEGNKRYEEIWASGFETPPLTTTLFPENYTAWRIGSRGYRVKLVGIKDVITGSDCPYQNCLESQYKLDDTGGDEVTVDLTKILY